MNATDASTGAPTYAESLTAYFRGWRYPLFGTIFLFLVMYLGWVGVGGGLHHLGGSARVRLAVGAVAALALLFGIFLINDAADREIDAIVHPDRPIPKGRASWRHVWATAAALLVASVPLSLAVGARAALAAAAMASFALAFYGWAKGGLDVPGSSEILTPVVSALFPLYALEVADCKDLRVFLGVVGYIYFADFSQDLLGGIHDQVGDRACNVKTFALAIGPRRTLWVSVLAHVVAVTAGASLVYFKLAGPLFAAVLLGLTVTNAVLYVRLFRAEDRELASRADRANHLAGMFFFLVSASLFVDYAAVRLAG